MHALTMDAPATTAKRKRAAADVVDDVSDAEVEEFYAILRRMRDASRRLACSGAAAAGRSPQRAPAWRPSFSWEDFAPAPPPPPPPAVAAAAQRQPAADERVAENATPPRPAPGLDLNAEPEPDAPPTPRATA